MPVSIIVSYFKMFTLGIFRPSLDLPRETAFISNNMSLSFIDKLLMAEDLGRSNINCGKTYSACEVPLVDLFTAKYIVF